MAIVTGGARGLGKAYAMRMAEEGAKLVVVDILDTGPVKKDIEAKGGEALALQTDVTDDYYNATVNTRCIKKIEKPEHLTGTIVFLASEDSDMITGQTIVVDGGAVFN